MADHPGTLLVVDDAELNRELLARRLARKGFKTETAECGERALELIARGNIDLVLLDVEMPGMNGLDVLEQIRKVHSPQQLPVVMVTGREDSQDITRALSRGANDYVTKPIDFQSTVDRIYTLLPGSQHT